MAIAEIGHYWCGHTTKCSAKCLEVTTNSSIVVVRVVVACVVVVVVVIAGIVVVVVCSGVGVACASSSDGAALIIECLHSGEVGIDAEDSVESVRLCATCSGSSGSLSTGASITGGLVCAAAVHKSIANSARDDVDVLR